MNIAKALGESGIFGAADQINYIETHISWIILVGDLAYKIKKPVDLGFVDFTTLEKRKFYREEEVRLNRRLAPELYIGVIEISGTVEFPSLGGTGDVFEYAVKMQRFAADRELNHMVNTALPNSGAFRQFAADLALFHAQAEIAGPESAYATPESLTASELDNFAVLKNYIGDQELLQRLQEIESWTKSSLAALSPRFARRKSEGKIRECHGDLHLGNLVYLDNRIVAFDCLEFNPDLRWIDVASEIAFLIMDLYLNGQTALARVVLDQYLEASGDYEIVALIDHYLVYRAMVRAKVYCIQLSVNREKKGHQANLVRYIELAEKFSADSRSPRLMITCGFSGSGKSWVSALLIELSETIRIRSDVVRKRQHDLDVTEDSRSGVGAGIYSPSATKAVYEELSNVAELVLDAGYSVIVDATFLDKTKRDIFAEIARRKSVPFHILFIDAPYDVLESRIASRQQEAKDPSEADVAVLKDQLETFEHLTVSERQHTLFIDSTLEQQQITESLQTLLVN